MMNFKTNFLLSIISSAVLCINACSEDGSLVINPGNQEPDTQRPQDPPTPQDPDDPQPPTEPCKDECTEGAKRCLNNAVWICEKSESECTTWQSVKECGTGTQCNSSSYVCEADCSIQCNSSELLRCNGNILQECVTDENGCGSWEFFEACDDTCDSLSHSCIQNKICSSECKPGEKKCGSNGIVTCIDSDGEGCGQWGEENACGENEECKADPVECIKACTSQCKAGETETHATSYRVCTDSDGHGCMKWVTEAQCKQGELFDTSTKKCKPVCGTQCEKFSIVFLPDTQEYVRPSGNGAILNEQLKWIHDNYKDENIKAVMHLGDMTDTNDASAWQMNDKAYAKYIDPLDLAYLPGTGNHDYLKCKDNSSAVDSCSYARGGTRISSSGKFNNNRFNKLKWSYAKFGSFKYTGNSYLTMNVSGIDFLLISLEFAPRKDTICWAEELINAHPNHKVIISTHAYLSSYADTEERTSSKKYTSGYTAGSSPDGLATGASGYELYKELAARHNNIILVASGHVSSNTFRLNKGNAGNWFGEMLVDYQEENPAKGECSHSHDNGGSGGGWMRILTFDPKNYKIEARTISSRPNSYFKGGVKKFYCTPKPGYPNIYYAVNPNDTPAKPLSSDDIDKANTTYHKFTVNYDFVTPVDYKVTDGNVGFTHYFINDVSNGNQDNPAVAMNRKTRDFVAVWDDEAYDNDSDSAVDTDGKGNHDIRARVLCNTGCGKVKQFTVNSTKTGHQHHPDVAMNTSGDFVIVWTSNQDNSVYMRKFNSNGKETLKETKVNTSGKADMATVAMADDGSYVVTWQNGDIYMRGFDASGKELFSQRKVSASELQSGGKRNLPDIGMANDGSFVITWEDDVDGNGYYEIRARGFQKNGSERIKEFTVNVISDDQQRDPSIGMNSNGDFTIAWEDDTDGNGIFRIRMRGFDKNGKQTMYNFVSEAGEDSTDPSICVSDNGLTYFSWAAKSFTDSKNNKRTHVAVQKSSKNDATESLVSPIYAGTQNQPAIACGTDARHIILWHDDLDGNNYYEIMGKGF